MDSDWLTGLLVVVMVTIAVALLWSGTMFGSGHKPAPIIIESPSPVIESKDNKKKPRQRTNAQQSPKATRQDVSEIKESAGVTPSSSSPDVTENLPSRSPRKKKVKAAKRDESSENVDETTEEATSVSDGMWQTQLSRQQKQELLRQRRQQENATQLTESTSPAEDSIEKQIASAADEVVTASNDDDSKSNDELMYLENNNNENDEADAWLVINEESSTS